MCPLYDLTIVSAEESIIINIKRIKDYRLMFNYSRSSDFSASMYLPLYHRGGRGVHISQYTCTKTYPAEHFSNNFCL
jgi:hypothetical protein